MMLASIAKAQWLSSDDGWIQTKETHHFGIEEEKREELSRV